MTAFETTFHVGPDGKAHIALPPEFANRDVRIKVEPTTNGGPHKPDDRRRILDRVLGTIDDPSFECPPQGDWSDRESLD